MTKPAKKHPPSAPPEQRSPKGPGSKPGHTNTSDTPSVGGTGEQMYKNPIQYSEEDPDKKD